VYVSVHDTGVGIPAERHAAVFEPFVQVHRTLSAPTGGTGLGLAISRELARAMDGDLTVESREGEGSTFVLRLPIAR
jgi:signal transduction histidine kinase